MLVTEVYAVLHILTVEFAKRCECKGKCCIDLSCGEATDDGPGYGEAPHDERHLADGVRLQGEVLKRIFFLNESESRILFVIQKFFE